MDASKKISKIVEQLTLLIIDNHSDSIVVKVDKKESEFDIEIKTDKFDEKMLSNLSHIPFRRNEIIEEYGWELLGDDSSFNESLHLIGSLVDNLEIKNEDEFGVIRLKRYEKA